MTLKIDVYMSEICGSYYELRENVEKALAELRIPADVEYRTFYYEDAISKNIMGSPSIWINGRDAFESTAAPGLT